MANKITLEAINGSLQGKTFDFEEKTRIFIGRQEDCGIVIPENTISRYHCVMEITPPEVKLQDFGSLNGTFLNGEKIGQRDRSQSWEEVKDEERQEYTLKDGDILGLGSKNEFKLIIEAAETCTQCGVELPSGYKDEETVPEDAEPMRTNSKGERICEACYMKNKQEQLEREIAEKKAVEEAEGKKAEEARIAAEKAEQARLAAEREEKKRQEQEKERERQEKNRQKREEDEARKRKEAEERKKKEAEQRHIEEEKRAEAERQRIAVAAHGA